MITVTERAKKELREILHSKVDWPGACLRLMDRGQGKIGFGIDIEAPGDLVVEYDGSKLLVVAPELAPGLKGITLDVDEMPEGARLVISEKS